MTIPQRKILLGFIILFSLYRQVLRYSKTLSSMASRSTDFEDMYTVSNLPKVTLIVIFCDKTSEVLKGFHKTLKYTIF